MTSPILRRLPTHRRRSRPGLEPLEDRALLTAGVLDPSFGGMGIVTTHVGSGGDAAGAAAVYPQNDPNGNAGKIITVGSATVGGKTDFSLVRYNPNGTLDASFDSGGVVTSSFNAYSDVAAAVAIQPDGKVVVGGYVTTDSAGDEDFALARYNANGTLDTSFGTGGLVTTHFTIQNTKKTNYVNNSAINSIVIQPWDDRIVVAGRATPVTNGVQSAAFALARYNTNGTFDTTFGTGGTVVTDPTSGADYANFVGLQTVNGTTRIVAVGVANAYFTDAIRYNLNGTIDTSFGVKGIATSPPYSSSALTSSLPDRAAAIQPDGKILAVGGWNIAPQGFGVLRFNTNGTLDTTLNGNGMVLTPNPTGLGGSAASVVVQLDGAIVLGGEMAAAIPNTSPQAYTHEFALERYTPTGHLDPTFGAGGTGIVLTQAGVASSRAGGTSALTLQDDGAIVAVGTAYNGSTVVDAVDRYLGDPQATTTTLTSSLDPSNYGDPVTFTATVSAGYGTPTGAVDFYDGTTWLGSAMLTTFNGVTEAVFTISTLVSGTHNIQAVYDGDSNDLSSTSASLSQVVN